MNSRKVLVNCSVIALQDTRFLYPCCKFCLCRSAEESGLRSRCIKCGFTCDIQNVDYRYRLSLRVSRGRNIFGVTVFGGCLNSFFGVTAGDFQRFVESEKSEGPHSLHQLLIKAVEDCFIGKSFVFGFKLSGLEAEACLLNEHNPSLGFGAESAQLVACQILSPNEAFLGMTVFAYLQSILQASRSASQETDCESLQKDLLLNSCEYTLPLCVRSHSEASGVGLTQLWQPASDMILCFSQDETSGKSFQQEVTADDVMCIASQHETTSGPKPEPEWPVKKLLFLSGRQADQKIWTPAVLYAEDKLQTLEPCEHQNESRCGTDAGRSCSIDKLHSPATSMSNPGTNTVSCSYQPGRSVGHHYSLQGLSNIECKTSAFKKAHYSSLAQNMSFALEDAPLSESLGSFVSSEPPISVTVDQGVHRPANNCKPMERSQTTPTKPNCPLMPLHNVTNVIREKYKERSLKRMHQKRKLIPLSMPYLSVTPKVSHIPKDSSLDSYDIKDTVSNSLKNKPVSMTSASKETITQSTHAVFTEMLSQGKSKKESPSCGYQDEYNCSADLFCQSVDTTSPDPSNRVVSDPKIKKQDCLSDINTSGREVHTFFHFAPSLQSTPIAYARYRHTHRQGHTLNSKFTDSPCSWKQRTPTDTHVLRNHSRIIQESKAGEPEHDQIHTTGLVNSDSGCVSEVQSVVELESEGVSSTNTNEWSRDLFTNSF